MKKNRTIDRRKFIQSLSTSAFGLASVRVFPSEKTAWNRGKNAFGLSGKSNTSHDAGWQIGIGKAVITPTNGVWLAGYGRKRVADGKIHDLWAKVIALKDAVGRRVVLVTTDHMGMSKTIYERLFRVVQQEFGLARSEFMLAFSHNHCGPCLEDDLVDYYPSDEKQRAQVIEYTGWMEKKVVAAVAEALANWQDCALLHGEGTCTFAVNRRDNKEAEVPEMLAKGLPLKGAVDHYVPVLAAKAPGGDYLAVLFGYACHPTTLDFTTWCGDYPGFAQINLEENYPGTAALFFNACGGDQNPLPRRKVELCKKYGEMLSTAVEEVLRTKMQSISPVLSPAFSYVDLAYEELVDLEKLKPIASGSRPLQARWANRMIKKIEAGEKFSNRYPFPVQAWKMGKELLFIGMGGEAVVDYSLRFKQEFPQRTWVCGYANYMAAYIPSRRVWEEGGYEGGPHLDEYGHPAWRWKGDIEDRITGAVAKTVKQTQDTG
ncbi:neutral/alkaline non-lysosomal ceramidase N-terminal domain-containing protein [Cyclobacterium xiamenense]|uniref:neutral/alkaline non-lysosomal ceramidase N-terminal domain-containing protein n=1 Tax=Cyclobacterium xiamenense TaxID=1297121 RepID=UPI0012B8E784|nr:neutral/alkaline non-lysosomal ceramidase N-terminal domain-containing protein [Cyclobacterium xiamenense]